MLVMIVDDSSNLRKITMRYLKAIRPDFEFLEAGDGLEALEKLQDHHIQGKSVDLVLLDWMMPRVSGYEFLKSIRSTEVFKENPKVIMLSAETYPEQIEASLKYNVSTYITKPFDQNTLKLAVIKAVGDGKDLKNAV